MLEMAGWQAMDDSNFDSAFMYVSFNMPFFVILWHFRFKFPSILMKDFNCFNSDNLRKRKPLFEAFSVTVILFKFLFLITSFPIKIAKMGKSIDIECRQ